MEDEKYVWETGWQQHSAGDVPLAGVGYGIVFDGLSWLNERDDATVASCAYFGAWFFEGGPHLLTPGAREFWRMTDALYPDPDDVPVAAPQAAVKKGWIQ